MLRFAARWQLVLGPGVRSDDAALESLKEQFSERFSLSLGAMGS